MMDYTTVTATATATETSNLLTHTTTEANRKPMKRSIINITVCACLALAIGITLAVIYRRPPSPPSWKIKTEFGDKGLFTVGAPLQFSKDGDLLAMGEFRGSSGKLFGVRVFGVDDGKQLGQPLRFWDISDQSLPKNSRHGAYFKPSYTNDHDLSLSGDGKTLVMSFCTLLFDNVYRNHTYSLCGTDHCYYGRVTVYKVGASNEWTDTTHHEYLLPTDLFVTSPSRLRVALSADHSTLAICRSRPKVGDEAGCEVVVEVFGVDDEGIYQRPIGVPVLIEGNTTSIAISINDDGTRFAVGGFEEATVYDLVQSGGEGGEWKRAVSPTATYGYTTVSAILSSSGKRMAVSTANKTKNYSQDNGYLTVFQWDDDDDQWKQVGNSILDRVSSDSGTGIGLVLSGDGTTIAHGRYESYAKYVRVFRLDKKGVDWEQVGDNVVGIPNSNDAALSYDGKRLATGPLGQSTDEGLKVVSVYDFRGGN